MPPWVTSMVACMLPSELTSPVIAGDLQSAARLGRGRLVDLVDEVEALDLLHGGRSLSQDGVGVDRSRPPRTRPQTGEAARPRTSDAPRGRSSGCDTSVSCAHYESSPQLRTSGRTARRMRRAPCYNDRGRYPAPISQGMCMAPENRHTHPNYSSGEDYILEFRSFRYGFNSVDFAQRVEMAAVELGLVEAGLLRQRRVRRPGATGGRRQHRVPGQPAGRVSARSGATTSSLCTASAWSTGCASWCSAAPGSTCGSSRASWRSPSTTRRAPSSTSRPGIGRGASARLRIPPGTRWPTLVERRHAHGSSAESLRLAFKRAFTAYYLESGSPASPTPPRPSRPARVSLGPAGPHWGRRSSCAGWTTRPRIWPARWSKTCGTSRAGGRPPTYDDLEDRLRECFEYGRARLKEQGRLEAGRL